MTTENAMESRPAPGKRLLLLSCTQRKRAEDGVLPAIERYDGPLFRVVRRYRNVRYGKDWRPECDPDVFILSAEFGLISAGHPIPVYDRRMTRLRAHMLRPSVVDALRRIMNGDSLYRDMFICLGRMYWAALEGWETYIPLGMTIYIAQGSMGIRQRHLCDWLHGAPPHP